MTSPYHAHPTVFSGNPLDRADVVRGDKKHLQALQSSEDARFLLIAEDRILTDMHSAEIAWQMSGKLRFLPCSDTIFLGLEGQQPRFATQLNGTAEDIGSMFENADQPAKFRDLRAIAMKFSTPHPDLAIMAQAKSMLDWHKRHQYCAQCGSESVIQKAGYERICNHCGAHHFPRTDPVVIMLAVHDDKALLARSPHFPPNFYSAPAGFMEPGETIEEAVARELAEETGIGVSDVHYIASQPWPFPSSLMIGCIATAKNTDITLDTNELEDARWVNRHEIEAIYAGQQAEIFLPPPMAVASTILKAWITS